MLPSLLSALVLTGCIESIWALPVPDGPQTNLPIVKTVTTPSGQVIDYVPVASQGNIASPPPVKSIKKRDNKALTPVPIIQSDPSLQGPSGTVPIARGNAQPLAKKQLPSNTTVHQPLASNYAGVHWYSSTAQVVNNHGGSGTFSLFKAYTQSSGDFSLIQTAVIRTNAAAPGGGTTEQTVEAGWINYIDQESAPHLFTYFTTNGYASEGDNVGGWNRDHAGWVQYDSTIFPGTEFTPYSTDGGSQYELEIYYTLQSGNWWLYVDDRYIGYYPANVFTKGGVSSANTLETSSNEINFYGEIYNSETTETTTDMCSGEFASTGFGKAGYIHNIAYYDTNGNAQNYDGSQGIIVSDSSRYSLQTAFNSGSSWGSYIYLGGPGAGGVIGG